ncbi:MAG: LCP family protein [Oscillospiraceae bacterium]|jgi:LCP family protein required for cell wall assembly|nr:LCP family protein [Oscillospiraceae bacterium]
MAFFRRPYTGKRVGEDDPLPLAEARGFLGWWRRRPLWLRILLISLAALAVLAAGFLITLRLMIRPPDADTPIVINQPSPSSVALPSDVAPEPTPSGAAPQPSPSPVQEVKYEKREGVYTFLLAGLNESLADTLIVVTLDTEAGTCHMLSVPRDTIVESAPRTVKKINSSYMQRSGIEEDDRGIPQLKKEIATLIGYQPEYAAVVDYDGFKRLIRAVDGVDFNVPMRMYVPGEGIDLQKGMQHLNAEQALQLVRFRVNPIDKTGYDDYGRMETQQKLLIAVAKKALANWGKIGEYIDIAKDNLTSDLNWNNMLWYAEQIAKIGMDNVEMHTLPTKTVIQPAEIPNSAHNGYYEMVLAEEALKLINGTINPFGIPIGEELVEYTKLTETYTGG